MRLRLHRAPTLIGMALVINPWASVRRHKIRNREPPQSPDSEGQQDGCAAVAEHRQKPSQQPSTQPLQSSILISRDALDHLVQRDHQPDRDGQGSRRWTRW